MITLSTCILWKSTLAFTMTRPWLLISWHSTWHFWSQNCNIKNRLSTSICFSGTRGLLNLRPSANSSSAVAAWWMSMENPPKLIQIQLIQWRQLMHYCQTMRWFDQLQWSALWNEKCDCPSPTLPRYLNHWVRHPSNMANMFGWWTRTQMIKIRALLVKLPVCVHVGHIWF